MRAAPSLAVSVDSCTGRAPFIALPDSRSCGSWLKMTTALPETSTAPVVVVADRGHRQARSRQTPAAPTSSDTDGAESAALAGVASG
jgi:hypothetical protein